MERKRQNLTPETTKKKLKLSTPDTTSHQSNLNFNCNKEVVIEIERLSESVVAEMTAGWSALPPEQTKKKLKLSTPKTKLHPSNPHFICDKVVVIQLDRLRDSFVAEMTAGGPALPLEQVIAELEQVKEERARDKINFETEKCELESKINKYEEQCTELQSEKEKLQSENEKLRNEIKKLQSEKENVQTENEKLQSENKRLQKYSQDLESSNVNVEEKSQMNLYNTDLNRQITKESSDDALDINSLPPEIILKIFGYFTQNQLGHIAQVCRRWNVMAKSPVLWKKVNVKFHYMHGSQSSVANCFVDLLPPSVTCIRLDFRFRSSWTEPLNFKQLSVRLQKKCPHLEMLFLYGAELSDNLPSVIHLCTLFLPDVRRLTLNYVNFRNYPAREELSRISKIEVLDLSNCYLGHFNAPPFSRMPHLKDLSLVDTNANNSFFQDCTSFLNQLCVLNLRRAVFISRLFHTIRNHGINLEELYVCGTDLVNSDLYFNNSVLPHLKTICLRYCNGVTYKGINFLLQSCPSLKNVYVSLKLASHHFIYGSGDIVKSLNCSTHQK